MLIYVLQRRCDMAKRMPSSVREIVRALILSPCYLTLTLRERSRLIKRLLANKPGSVGFRDDSTPAEGAQT